MNISNNVEKDVYSIIKNRINCSEEEFLKLPNIEKTEWEEACRLALILEENKPNQLYEGYGSTEMYVDGKFDLAAAAEIIRKKKKIYDVVDDYISKPSSLTEFILLGESKTTEIVNAGLKSINEETAKELND